MQRNLKSRVVKLEKVMRPGRPDGSVFFLLWGADQQDLEGRLAASKEQGEIVADDIAVCVVWPSHEFQQCPLVGIGGSASVHNLRKLGESIMMERKVICDLNLISVDFGREEELQPGNIFRITFRHVNGERTGAIDVYQGEAEHFALELEAVAAFLRAALSLVQTKSQTEAYPTDPQIDLDGRAPPTVTSKALRAAQEKILVVEDELA